MVDADALNIVGAVGIRLEAQRPGDRRDHAAPGGDGRLAGTDTKAVQADRIGTAERYAREHGVVVVLKGAETVVAASGEPTHIDRTTSSPWRPAGPATCSPA